MELVYTYAMESSKDMQKMMDEEFWKRLGPTVRECKAMGLEKRACASTSKPKTSWPAKPENCSPIRRPRS